MARHECIQPKSRKKQKRARIAAIKAHTFKGPFNGSKFNHGRLDGSGRWVAENKKYLAEYVRPPMDEQRESLSSAANWKKPTLHTGVPFGFVQRLERAAGAAKWGGVCSRHSCVCCGRLEISCDESRVRQASLPLDLIARGFVVSLLPGRKVVAQDCALSPPPNDNRALY